MKSLQSEGIFFFYLPLSRKYDMIPSLYFYFILIWTHLFLLDLFSLSLSERLSGSSESFLGPDRSREVRQDSEGYGPMHLLHFSELSVLGWISASDPIIGSSSGRLFRHYLSLDRIFIPHFTSKKCEPPVNMRHSSHTL